MPTVKIWMKPSGMAYRLGMGHAGLSLAGGTYITWLSHNRGISEGTCSAGHANLRISEWTFDRDAARLGRPNFSVTIPDRDFARGNRCGIDVTAITNWWNGLPPVRGGPQRRYQMISTEHNCCAYVVRALKAGHAERYVKAPTNLVFQGARTLLTWANELSIRINLVNAGLGMREPTLRNAVPALPAWAPPAAGAVATPVWTAATWRAQSAVTLGRRREQVAAIDDLLPKYHGSMDADEQLRLLCDILMLALDHLRKKANSDRRSAVCQLARQAFEHLRVAGVIRV